MLMCRLTTLIMLMCRLITLIMLMCRRWLGICPIVLIVLIMWLFRKYKIVCERHNSL